MRQGVCGWCGIMSPLNRLAFVEDFGAQTVTLAEVEARRRMADKAKEYAATNHAAHVAEANQNEQRNAAPVAGSFVWAVETGLKNEGQGMAGVIADAVEGYDVRRRLVCVERVINATAADFLRPSLADELVKADAERGEKFPGGSRNDDDSYTDFFDIYKTWYTVAAAVVDPSGRWFLIDADGYDYARYILMPTNWGEQFATEKAAAEQKKADREEQERREAEQQAADRMAAYVELCNKWAHLMTDLRPLVAAEKAAADKYGYRSKEAKAAARKLQAARRGNVSAMVRAAFPGLRLSMTVNNGWGSAYDLTYYDGPTRDRFDNETDLDLFEAIAYTFDGMTDYADFDRHEFTDFSEKFFACNYGGVKVDREQSDENAAAMLAAIVETVPAAADNEPREWTADELQAVAARLGCDAHELAHRLANYRQTLTASDVARIAFHICDFAAQKPQEPTTPTDPTNGKANAVEAATSDENAPAEGLELVEIADGVAVVGDSRTTYRNRKAIKAHGARWNRDAQQWQATTPEAVEQLRQWFGVAQDEQPEPTTEANDTTTTATEAAQAPETTAADQQPTDDENGAQSAQNEPEEFRTVEFYNREGVTDEQGHRVKTHDQIKQQAARIECNYIAGRDGLRGIARRLERTKGADAPETLAAYERLQSRAAWLRRAELAAHAAAGRKHRAAYLRGTDPTPTPGGKGAEGIQSQTEGTNPVIEASEIDGFSKTENRAADSLEVTNPIKADDLNTPRVLQLSERRDIVTGCTSEQADELERMGGKPTAAGVVFRASNDNRHRLHVWQNEQSRKGRAAILGDGWQWIEGINHGTEPGDLITCTDGTRGRVTKSSPESCCIEFETEGGQRLSVAGYFRKESPRYRAAENSQISEKRETGTTFADALEIREGDRVLSKHFQTMGTVTGIYEWNGGMCYDVTLDKAVKGLSGETITKTAFRRYGITKNYYPQGNAEIVGNAIYYAEELQAGFWGTDSTPRTIFDCEIFKPTDRRPSWLLVTDIFSSPKEMTLQQVADYLAARYQDAQNERRATA